MHPNLTLPLSQPLHEAVHCQHEHLEATLLPPIDALHEAVHCQREHLEAALLPLPLEQWWT